MGLLAVVAILLGVGFAAALAITPNLAQTRDQWRVERTRDRLTMLTDGLTAIFPFHEDLTEYPKALSQLSSPVAAGDPHLCNGTYGNSSGNWGGRYAGRIYPTTGTPVPIGLMQDTLEYDPTGPAMVLVIADVREEQARYLDRQVDGVADAAAGRVRYSGLDEEGRLTLRWRTTIASC